MCLAVPGKIISIHGEGPLNKVGQVNFSGVLRNVNLAYVPEAQVGDYVLVHVGFALSRVDPKEAESLISDIDMIAQKGKEEWEKGEGREVR